MSIRKPLDDASVHVWAARSERVEAQLWDDYVALLSEAERERLGRFRFERNRREFCVAHVLVRETLSAYADVDPKDWAFETNAHGRPEVAARFGVDLRFNLSHTDGLVACAVCRSADVGVDVEAMDRRTETVEIAERFFSARELADLRALPFAEQRDRFFVYWTLKESYIKARGLGLALPLDQFSFLIESAAPIRIATEPALNDDPHSWQFWYSRFSERHSLAMGVRRGNGEDFAVEVFETVPMRR